MNNAIIPLTEDIMAPKLDALGNPVRLKLYRLLVKTGEQGLGVSTIQEKLGIPASTLAHHLGKLVQAELVLQSRSGRQIISCANYPMMDQLVNFLTEACCQYEEAPRQNDQD